MTEQTVEPHSPVIAPSQALEFLTRAGEVLGESLDYEETLSRVVQLAVPEVADWCAIYVEADDGEYREMTSAHPDPEVEEALAEIRRQRRQRGDASETLRVIETGQSLLASDVRGEVAAELTGEQRARIERLGPRAFMVVPLRARGRVMGALTLLSTTEGRHYTQSDLSFAETLAVRCAFAIDNALLYHAAERARGLLDATFTSVPVGLAFVDRDLRYVRVNDALAEMNAAPVADHIGRTPEELLGPAAAPVMPLLREVVDSGRPMLALELSGEYQGVLRHFVSSYTPVRGSEDDVVGIAVTVVDVTEHRALLDAEREARVRAHFLAEAGALLDSSLDYEETLATVARIAVPEVADWCGVSILDDDGILREVAAAHSDPDKREIGRELRDRFPPSPDATTGTVGVVRSGATEFVPEVTDAMLEAGIPDPEQLRLVRALGLRSVIIAPLSARGRTSGTITLANAESGRRFDERDLELANDLARRAGLAIANARLYTERARIADTLQAGLLPSRLPSVPGLDIAARYRAAGELNDVGGDFYDVFPRADGTWAFVVGDVSGKGAEAASITALARYTLRATDRDPGSPSRALIRLNEAMLAQGTKQFATVVLAHGRLNGRGELELELALAGHPPPVVVRGGDVGIAGEFGSLLGVHADKLELFDTRLTLAAGDTLLLYTDGVIEAGARSQPVGQAGLERQVRSLVGRASDDIVAEVERFVVDAQEGEPSDDIALLAIQVSAPGADANQHA